MSSNASRLAFVFFPLCIYTIHIKQEVQKNTWAWNCWYDPEHNILKIIHITNVTTHAIIISEIDVDSGQGRPREGEANYTHKRSHRYK